ncbi:MAG: winged helix-turn-helix domain-containing protein [Gammaproteobacteria bacterium]|nr:winged helix-turn-helix domain-containing protein [Gammaproteobacteria bacterium]
MKSFSINNCSVDTQRHLVFRNGECISLEPKVFQVLLFLAQHPGEVVSHQTLLEAIWSNVVVEPGALQRCIARLRKAFGDDARQQHVIATYPKQGYSLVADLRWETLSDQQQQNTHFNWQSIAASLAVVILILAGALVFIESDDTDYMNGENQVTEFFLLENPDLQNAIGNPDTFPVYSPDGRYVVYPSYQEERKAHLWARDLAYSNDFLLTDEAGMYEYLSWSRDSSRIVFVDTTCEANGCLPGQCSSLKSVSVSQSETNALFVETLVDCKAKKLLAPEWLNNNQLAVIELDRFEASLVQYDLKTLTTNLLFKSTEQIPYQQSYSRQTNILTMMAVNASGQKELMFLDINTGAIIQNDTAVFDTELDWYPSSNPQ